MIILLHGDNIDASRAELLRMIGVAKGKEIRQLSGRSIEPSQLVQAMESSSLFGGDTLVVIENLFGKLGRQIKKIGALSAILLNAANANDVILWEDKELTASVVKTLGGATVRTFKTPTIIFQFLDGLRPKSAATLVPLFRKVAASQPAEISYTLLVRRVRQLIQAADHVTPDGLAPWQAARLTAQARLFTMDELVSMHTKLLDMDISIKTGATPFSLAQLIEQFCISL